jgi:ABC-type multidrug transport system ATPase subunit
MTVDTQSGESLAIGSAGAAVRVNGLTKRFGLTRAVNNVSLTVERGTAFGLIGPNGAGKTTTFSVVAGYLRPTQGSVEVLGLRPTEVDALRSRLGVLPEDAVLPPSEPVGEFLVHLARLQGIPGQKAVASAYDALADVDGTAWWRQRCGSLSHGMAKRVALAQAFLGQPEVVLLDEPTAGLDPRAAFEMRQYIKAKRGKTAIVISSHNVQELEELCDTAAILDRGCVVAAGTMADLTASNEEVRVTVAHGSRRGTEAGAVPMQALRDIPDVRAIDFDDEALVLAVSFDRTRADAEAIIGRVLTVLLGNHVRISGVVKGRGLEKRVRDLT